MDALAPLLDPALTHEDTVALSRRAWALRFAALPTCAADLLDDERVARLSPVHRRAVVFVCARRLQYGFANRLLLDLLADVRMWEPALVELSAFEGLELFARCCTGEDRWDELLDLSASGDHVLSDLAATAAFIAADVPGRVCRRLLHELETAAAEQPLAPVPAYRRVILLRRLGRLADARAMLDVAFTSLLTRPIDPGFADHMSERLVGEALALQVAAEG